MFGKLFDLRADPLFAGCEGHFDEGDLAADFFDLRLMRRFERLFFEFHVSAAGFDGCLNHPEAGGLDDLCHFEETE